LSNTAFSKIVPVARSTALSTNVSLPSVRVRPDVRSVTDTTARCSVIAERITLSASSGTAYATAIGARLVDGPGWTGHVVGLHEGSSCRMSCPVRPEIGARICV